MARRTRRKNARIHNGNIPATAPAVRTTASSCTGAGGGAKRSGGAEDKTVHRPNGRERNKGSGKAATRVLENRRDNKT